MKKNDEIYENALKVAHLYYYNGLTTELIAKEMKFSRPKVSRLLSFAREEGLVEIKIIDKHIATRPLEKNLLKRFKALHELSIVSVPEVINEHESQQRVAQFTANHLNNLFEINQICGIAWHPILLEVSRYLTPKKIQGLEFIQLHGQYTSSKNGSTGDLIHNFSKNYQAKSTILPVPVFFDYPATKNALWQEASVQNVLEIQKNADILLFSVCDFDSQIKSHQLYIENYINEQDIVMLKGIDVVGEISTMFFRPNGSYANVSFNARSSGPTLDMFKNVAHSVCIVSGKKTVPALIAALDAGYISDLITDENTAKELLKRSMLT